MKRSSNFVWLLEPCQKNDWCYDMWIEFCDIVKFNSNIRKWSYIIRTTEVQISLNYPPSLIRASLCVDIHQCNPVRGKKLSWSDTLKAEVELASSCLPLTIFVTTIWSMYAFWQFLLVCSSVISYVAFVLSSFVLCFTFFWYLGRAVLRDWTFHIYFFHQIF